MTWRRVAQVRLRQHALLRPDGAFRAHDDHLNLGQSIDINLTKFAPVLRYDIQYLISLNFTLRTRIQLLRIATLHSLISVALGCPGSS